MALERYTADADLAEFFQGLRDDQCQAGHWGNVLTGKVTFKTASGEESFETGDAYYIPPGHTPTLATDNPARLAPPLREVTRCSPAGC